MLIDTHSHLLPGVDHGSPDMKTSLQMAGAAAASGIRIIVCTPHLHEWDEGLVQQTQTAIDEMRGALSAAEIDLTLVRGFEVDPGVASVMSPEQLEILSIEGSDGAILLEMPYTGWPVYMEDMVFRLATTGFRPVLAHPERNDRIQSSSDLLVGCLQAGAIAQATAASLTGEFGRSPAQTLRRLLREGHVALLASDAHAFRKSGWTMDTMLVELADLVNEEGLALLTHDNPARLLAGESRLEVPGLGNSRMTRRPWRLRRRKDGGTV